jgi:uncharacterized membrane protein
MVGIEASVTVNRALSDVFRYVQNNENAMNWMSGLLDVRMTNNMSGVGKTWVDIVQVLGRRVEVESRVTEFDPEKLIGFKSTSGPFPLEGRFEFEPAGAGTKVTYSLRGEPGGFFKLAEPLVKRSVQRQWETNLANLKDMLEQNGAS